MTFTIHTIGDSHSRYLQTAGYIYKRLGIKPKDLQLRTNTIMGASIAGLRPQSTKLDTKEKINEALHIAGEDTGIVIALGQVDLELGYYHRIHNKGEKITPQTYVTWLIQIYENFVTEIPKAKNVALKGVNLTVLGQPDFTKGYISRIIQPTEESEERLEEIILTETEQNKMHLQFNEELKKLSKRNNIKYFDINKYICRRDEYNQTPQIELGLREEYRPGKVDHHLVDSLAVRAIHIRETLRTFSKENILSD